MTRSLLFRPVEAFWTLFFAAWGKLFPFGGEVITFSGRDRVLVIAPHPDDETLGCGGTIGQHIRAGDIVRVMVVTDGGKSRAMGLSHTQIIANRRQELREALLALSPHIGLDHCALPEGNWAAGALEAKIRTELADFRPSLIYAPSCVDFHLEHINVARTFAKALRDNSDILGIVETCVRVYEIQVPLTPILANRLSLIEGSKISKAAALAAYQTQALAFSWVPRQARYLKRAFDQRSEIEVFWEMPASSYGSLFVLCSESRSGYRSIRSRPFSDGLAWVNGFKDRQTLKRLANRS